MNSIPTPIRTRNRLRWGAGIVSLLGAGAAFLGWLGYFGGPVMSAFSATAPGDGTAAVVLSGDMGLKVGMGTPIAQALADRGIPVVAVNSLTFFRTRRSAQEVARLVDSAAARALSEFHARRLVMIGQSFGADMLHVGLADAPSSLRAKIAFVALVAPTDDLEFRASPSELFNLAPSDGPALPSAMRLDWVPGLCLYGVQDDRSLCPHLRLANMRRVGLPGGHLFNRDTKAVINALVSAISQALRK